MEKREIKKEPLTCLYCTKKFYGDVVDYLPERLTRKDGPYCSNFCKESDKCLECNRRYGFKCEQGTCISY